MKIVSPEENEPVDENRVLERVLAGDADAYGHFVRTYQRRVYGMALRMLRDAGEAECVAQDAFVKAYRSLADFRGGSSFETWILRIAVNACRDRLKRKRLVLYFHQRRADDGGEDGPVEAAPSPDPSPDRLLESKEIKARLREAIDSLSPRQRIVFALKHLEERSIPEIADLLGLDSGTVKSHLFRAAQKVRARLGDFRRAP
ncbi:MAG TPA: sigma-70 family RNA polymerase sigma factor [Thermoanaerobaculia bacterium]|nr:sigma-70 family RNA polymerase sigma factor [Thermoanaerobaculia bacterium]